MKFRNPKTGEVFEDIGTARESICVGRECNNCLLNQFNQGELYGNTCAHFTKEYPAEAARLMGYEVVVDHVGDVTDMIRPRICEVLGGKDNPIEPGEHFMFRGMEGYFFITGAGDLVSVDGDAHNFFTRAAALINCPDRIIRKPRFTEDEVAMARMIKKKYPWANYIAMEDELTPQFTDSGFFAPGTRGKCISLPREFMPAVQNGQSVSIKDIVGCGNGR